MLRVVLLFLLLFIHQAASARPELCYSEIERTEQGPRLGIKATLATQGMTSVGPYQLSVTSCVVNQVFPRLFLAQKEEQAGQLIYDAEGDPFTLHLAGLTWGDAVRLTLRGEDTGEVAELVVIPFPIQATNEEGHWALLTRLDRYGTTFGFKAGGYKPGEEITLALVLEEERCERPIQARRDGTFETVIKSHAHSKTGGVALVTVVAENGELPVAYHWGGPCG